MRTASSPHPPHSRRGARRGLIGGARVGGARVGGARVGGVRVGGARVGATAVRGSVVRGLVRVVRGLAVRGSVVRRSVVRGSVVRGSRSAVRGSRWCVRVGGAQRLSRVSSVVCSDSLYTVRKNLADDFASQTVQARQRRRYPVRFSVALPGAPYSLVPGWRKPFRRRIRRGPQPRQGVRVIFITPWPRRAVL